MDTKAQNPDLPRLPDDPLRGGLQMAGNVIDPSLVAAIEQIAHSGLDQLLQWALKNIVPVLVQSLSAQAGAGKVIVSEANTLANVMLSLIQQVTSLPANANPAGAIPEAGGFKMGLYPHGDVDLRFMGANVAPDVRPEKAPSKRTFYFLEDSKTPQQIPRARAGRVGSRIGQKAG